MRSERKAYTRYTIVCDWCGKEWNHVVLHEEPMDSVHQLPPPEDWLVVPVARFSSDMLDACSREHAEALALRELAAVNRPVPQPATATAIFNRG